MLKAFTIRGGEDWLLFAARVDAPDDDRVYIAVTECWPVWLDVERRFGAVASLKNPAVLASVARAADDAHFRLGFLCDACGQRPRYASADGIRSLCGCDVDSYGDPVQELRC